MKLKVIRIEERNGKLCKERMLKLFGDTRGIIYTDLETRSSGIMTNLELKRDYFKMVGKSRGKDCYMRKLTRDKKD